jgi:hypothetical protein
MDRLPARRVDLTLRGDVLHDGPGVLEGGELIGVTGRCDLRTADREEGSEDQGAVVLATSAAVAAARPCS